VQSTWSDLKKFQSRHRELQASHLEQLAEAIVLHQSPQLCFDSVEHIKEERKAKQIKLLIKREKTRRYFRKLGHLLRENTNKGFSKIDVPDHHAPGCGDPADPQHWSGPWQTITNQREIATVVATMNTKQYNQAEITPFGSGPLAQAVGRRGDTNIADGILRGHTNNLPPCQFPETSRIIDTLARPHPKADLPSAIIMKEEFISSYKAAKESTSSSPSGRHIGHYKGIVNDPTLVSMHASMMSIPFHVGIVPDRWKRITDIMLEKTPGDSRCHRLRIIALFESNLSHAKRILIGHKIAHHLEYNNMILEMQFGSRSGRRCLSAVLKKILCHEHIRLSRQTRGFIENDATGYYDRLMNNLILMVLKKTGLTPLCFYFHGNSMGCSNSSHKNALWYLRCQLW
jgi:hypothetical protein